MHPKPTPVKLSPKVAEPIAIEASLDFGDHDLYQQDDPTELIANYDEAARGLYYIRVLMSGELTEARAVLRDAESTLEGAPEKSPRRSGWRGCSGSTPPTARQPTHRTATEKPEED